VNRALETERHRLRPIRAAESTELHALFTDLQVRRWLFDDEAISEAVVMELITASDALEPRGLGHWTVRARSDDRLIGSAALQPCDGEEIELIYLLAPAEWGQGHASEVGQVLLAHAFETLGLERVIAQADTPNTKSIDVMKRLGMRFDRELEVGGLPLVQYVMERETFSGR
jgi:RimJ/RimL family protein N-acetyltransferase